MYICSMEDKVQRIIEQVRKLYQRYGIKSVTMDDVARQLCISKKTLYEHFTDKEDLVRRVMLMEHEHWSVFFQDIEKKELNAVEEVLDMYKLIHTIYKDFNPSMEYDVRKYYPDLYNKVKEVRRKRMYESVYRNLNKGKKEGLYRKDLNSRIIAKLHVVRIESMFENELFSIEELTSFKVYHEIFFYHIYGILSPAGLTFFQNNFKKFKVTI
jgi:TetR/AcrR family transcriptional regulator, cholesterol catabolism regulator